MNTSISRGDKIFTICMLIFNTLMYYFAFIIAGLSEIKYLYLIPIGLTIFQWLAFYLIVSKNFRREFLIPLWFGPFIFGIINLINLAI